jgi:hypothetical protein
MHYSAWRKQRYYAWTPEPYGTIRTMQPVWYIETYRIDIWHEPPDLRLIFLPLIILLILLLLLLCVLPAPQFVPGQ